MLKKLLIALLLLSALLTVPVSCKKKYPDGPPFSLSSKKKRMASDWKLNQARLNGENKTSYEGFSTCWLTIEEDNEYSVKWQERRDMNTIGKWKWVDRKRSISFDCDLWFYKLDGTHNLTYNTYNNSQPHAITYRITRLTTTELWMYNVNDFGDKVELRFNAVEKQ